MKRLLIAWLIISGCSAPFPETDIADVVKNKTANFLTDNATEYSAYVGYSSECAHPGVHANFAVGTTYNIYAVTNGIITSVENCASAGNNDKYNIELAIGMSGAVTVFFDYSIEPFAGTNCSAGYSDYFNDHIFVEEGQEVKKGELIAKITPGSESDGSAHIHYNLKIDGATVCPDIFPTTIFSSGSAGTQRTSADCTIPSGVLCHELTSSEDPENLL